MRPWLCKAHRLKEELLGIIVIWILNFLFNRWADIPISDNVYSIDLEKNCSKCKDDGIADESLPR